MNQDQSLVDREIEKQTESYEPPRRRMVISANRLYLRRLMRGRATRIILAILIVVSILDVVRIHAMVARGEEAASSVVARRERVYIASMHWNNGDILRRHWNEAVLGLVEALGRDRVFVSVYESGSWDDSKEVLAGLDRELQRRGVARRVETSDVTHLDEMSAPDDGEGWVMTARGRRELRRIPFLARLRNRTIRDLVELAQRGVTFDKVLFLNDVVFTPQDVLTLMATNGGEYAAACSLDFSKPPEYYDTFALRDSRGGAHLMQTWPYFGSRASRHAMVNHLDAVPVTSCWNGIVAMQAKPFTSSTPLRFRAVPDSLAAYHLEGSECCLIHVDNPLSRTLGVYVNPRVRVGYDGRAYAAVHPGGTWVSAWDIFRGVWMNRIRRWTVVSFDGWVVRSRLGRWEKEREGNHEPGELCLINEMQVIVERGWAHV